MVLKRRDLIIAKFIVHALCLIPLAHLVHLAYQEQTIGNGALGADPVAAIEHELGIWAIRFLMIALAVSPLRDITRNANVLRFRRLLGLYAFAYASLHFAAFAFLDLGLQWSSIGTEIVKRPYITVGFAAWCILALLAMTSFRRAQRLLARNWTRLHRLVYAAAVFAVLHFWWLVKSDVREPLLYACVAALLLGWRLWFRKLRIISDRTPKAASPRQKSTRS